MLKALLPVALAVSAIPALASPIAARAVPTGFSMQVPFHTPSPLELTLTLSSTSISSSGVGCPAGSASYALNGLYFQKPL